jgi:hypothetical protein
MNDKNTKLYHYSCQVMFTCYIIETNDLSGNNSVFI